MKRRIKLLTISLTLFILIFSGINSAYSALKEGHRKIIRVAYMNGYIAALKLDLEEIRELRKDKSLLKLSVKDAANRYLERVSQMNPGG